MVEEDRGAKIHALIGCIDRFGGIKKVLDLDEGQLKGFLGSQKCTIKDLMSAKKLMLEKDNDLEEDLKEHPEKIFTTKGQSQIFDKVQPYFYDKTGSFWLWDDKLFKWERQTDDIDVLNMIEEQTGQDVISPRKRSEIINSLKQQGRKNIPNKIKSNWIQFKDKLYDIETGENIEATPQFFVTNPIPHEVSHNPDTPIIDKLFKEWVGEDYVKTLYQIIAYCILPNYPIHRIFCLNGAGLNGKGCFLRLLGKFIGKSNICSTELDLLTKSRFECGKLHKKLVCQMGETNFSQLDKTSILKKLSGQDDIGIEFKNKTPFDDVNYAKIIIATNSLPSTGDKTIGFYRRWMIIDFPNTFNEEKDVLKDIPEEEYDNLATKCLTILKELLEKRKFHNEGTIEERMKRYEDRSDYLRKFLKDFTIYDPDGYITKNEFARKFEEWCVEKGYRKLSDKTISSRLLDIGIEAQRKWIEWTYCDSLKRKQARSWVGIKWKGENSK